MSPTPELRDARALDLATLAALFNRAYEGYAVPMHLDPDTMAFLLDTFDLVPERSPVAWDGDEAVGIAMLGLRGERGWVGGMGVVPARRRRGLATRLMHALIEQARAAGARTLGLEVLEPNTSARALYEKLGFTATRRVEVFEWDGPPAQEARATACAPREAQRRIVAVRTAPEPWQRDDDTLARLDLPSPALRAATAPGGDVVYRVLDERATVLQLAAVDRTVAGLLLDTVRSRDGVALVRFANVPEDAPAAAALHERGARLLVAQHEMTLAL